MAIANATWAYDGRVTVKGKIEEEGTCQIKTSDQNLEVRLPTVSTQLLKRTNDTAGETPFSIHLSNCRIPDYDRVLLIWGGGNLPNTASSSPAQNVVIKITKAADRDWATYLGAKDHEKAVDSGKDNIQPRFDYIAQYFATGKATAGNVQANVIFKILYE